jgi:hypothetical protein
MLWVIAHIMFMCEQILTAGDVTTDSDEGIHTTTDNVQQGATMLFETMLFKAIQRLSDCPSLGNRHLNGAG